jgi:hypothetical protein
MSGPTWVPWALHPVAPLTPAELLNVTDPAAEADAVTVPLSAEIEHPVTAKL